MLIESLVEQPTTNAPLSRGILRAESRKGCTYHVFLTRRHLNSIDQQSSAMIKYRLTIPNPSQLNLIPVTHQTRRWEFRPIKIRPNYHRSPMNIWLLACLNRLLTVYRVSPQPFRTCQSPQLIVRGHWHRWYRILLPNIRSKYSVGIFKYAPYRQLHSL